MVITGRGVPADDRVAGGYVAAAVRRCSGGLCADGGGVCQVDGAVLKGVHEVLCREQAHDARRHPAAGYVRRAVLVALIPGDLETAAFRPQRR